MAVQPTIKKTKGKKKPQAGALKQTKTGSMMKPKLAAGKATGGAKAKKAPLYIKYLKVWMHIPPIVNLPRSTLRCNYPRQKW